MSRLKSWTRRISVIWQRLDTTEKLVWTRPEVEALFIIGRSRAVDLMRVAGAEVGPNGELTITTSLLKFYVEHCPEAAAFLAEEARLRKVARELRAKSAASDRAVRFGAMISHKARPSDHYTKLETLTDMAIADGKLTIVFTDANDLAYKLYLLAKAEAANPQAFWQMVDAAAPKAKPSAAEESEMVL